MSFVDSFIDSGEDVFEYSDAEMLAELAGRSKVLTQQYNPVFISVLENVSFTRAQTDLVHNTQMFAKCVNGRFSLAEEDQSFQPYACPYAVLTRLVAAVNALYQCRSGTEINANALFMQNFIQFTRCYALVSNITNKLAVAAGMEWLIAQFTEVAALFGLIGKIEDRSGIDISECLQSVVQCGAFVICLAHGEYLLDPNSSPMLEDFIEGIKSLTTDKSSDQYLENVISAESDILRYAEEGVMALDGLGERFKNEFKEATGTLPKCLPISDAIMDTSWKTVHALCIHPKIVPDLFKVVKPLHSVFHRHNRELDLVHWAIDRDVKSGVKEANSLFRTPSTATRLLRTVFFSFEGEALLAQLIMPTIRKVWRITVPVELNPVRLPPARPDDPSLVDDTIKYSLKVVLGFAENVLTNVFRSVSLVPVTIRKFLLYARNTVIGVTHDNGEADENTATQLVVASLFFLRFICPAFVTPHAYNLIEETPPPEVQRVLILIGKVLQNCASGVAFDGSKEEYMSPCNSFVLGTQKRMLTFFQELIDAQSIGTRELKVKKAEAKQKNKRIS